jgi:sugar lactone lactonase YvrE
MAGDPDLLARAAALALARAALARGAVVQCAWFDNRLHPPQGLHSPKEIAAFVQQQQRGPVDLPRVLTAAREHVHALFSDFATIEIQWLLHAQSGTEHVSIIRELARQLRTRTGSSALFLSPGATPTEPPVLANVLASRWAALGSAALHDAEERAQAVRALRGLARPTRRETLLREKPAPRHRPRPEASTRAQQKAPRYVVGAHFQSKLEGHTHWLHSVAWAPDGTMLATASADTTVCLWHAADNILLHTLSGHSEAVRAVAWAPDGNILASASWDRTVRLWRVADGTLLHTLEGHNGWLYGVAWAPDAQTLATACEDTNIWLWRVADGTLARTLTGHSKRVNEVHWSSDGHMLASASDDKTVKLWRVADGVNQRTLEGHAGHVTAVAWAPDGQTLASASNDSTIRLWRVADGSTLRILRGHDKRVNSVAWAPDGQTLVSAAWDDTRRLWRVTDGTLIRTLTGHNSAVLSVAWAPDGQTLASAAWDLMVRLWRVEYE